MRIEIKGKLKSNRYTSMRGFDHVNFRPFLTVAFPIGFQFTCGLAAMGDSSGSVPLDPRPLHLAPCQPFYSSSGAIKALAFDQDNWAKSCSDAVDSAHDFLMKCSSYMSGNNQQQQLAIKVVTLSRDDMTANFGKCKTQSAPLSDEVGKLAALMKALDAKACSDALTTGQGLVKKNLTNTQNEVTGAAAQGCGP
jgi:hypothetical protein